MIIFFFGSIGYACFEILFRGYTHWTMMITGGACVLTLFILNMEAPDLPLPLRALGGTIIITTFEFFVGLIVNHWFGWDVWDYTAEPGNLLGLICPLFSFYWFLISLVLCFVFDKLSLHIIKKEHTL